MALVRGEGGQAQATRLAKFQLDCHRGKFPCRERDDTGLGRAEGPAEEMHRLTNEAETLRGRQRLLSWRMLQGCGFILFMECLTWNNAYANCSQNGPAVRVGACE